MKKIKTYICVTVLVVLAALSGCSAEKTTANDCYEITAEYYDNGLIAVDLSLNYRLRSKKQKEIVFNLNPAFLSDDVLKENKQSLKGFNIISVSIFDKAAKTSYYDNNENALSVDVSEYKHKRRVRIKIKYTVTVSDITSEEFVKNDTIDLSCFIPVAAVYDGKDFIIDTPTDFCSPLTADVADYKVKLTVPSVYTVAASGKARSCDLSYDRTVYRYEENSLRSFSVFLSKSYNVNIKKSGNRSVINCFYQDDDGNEAVNFSIKCLDFYEKSFGTFLSETFTVCQADSVEYFKTFSNLVVVPKEAFTKDCYRLLATAIAEQWWGIAIGGNQIKDYSLFGAAKEYSAYLFFHEHPEYGIDCKDLEKQSAAALSEYFDNFASDAEKEAFQCFPSTKPVCEYKTLQEYLIAVRDMPFLAALRYEETIGSELLLKKLQRFYQSNKLKTVSRADFEGLFYKV